MFTNPPIWNSWQQTRRGASFFPLTTLSKASQIEQELFAFGCIFAFVAKSERVPAYSASSLRSQRVRSARLSNITGTRPTSTKASEGKAASPSRSSRAS